MPSVRYIDGLLTSFLKIGHFRVQNYCSSDVVYILGALVMKQRTAFSHSDGKDALSSLSRSTSANLPVISFQQYVQSWSGKQIARWVEGIY